MRETFVPQPEQPCRTSGVGSGGVRHRGRDVHSVVGGLFGLDAQHTKPPLPAASAAARSHHHQGFIAK